MLVLFETPSGYAIFKLLDESKLSRVNDLHREFSTPDGAASVVELKHFIEFETNTEALDATFNAFHGKVSKTLKRALEHVCMEDQLLVGDDKLGRVINEKFGLQCLSNSNVRELLRCIRLQMDSLLKETLKKDMTALPLGLNRRQREKPINMDKLYASTTCNIEVRDRVDDMFKLLDVFIMRSQELRMKEVLPSRISGEHIEQPTAADSTKLTKSIKKKTSPGEAEPAKNVKIEKKMNQNQSLAPEADIPSKIICLASEATEENSEAVPVPPNSE